MSEQETPFELIIVGDNEDEAVPVFIAHSGLGRLKITATKRVASGNPLLMYIRAEERGEPGTFLPTVEGKSWLDDEAVALEFHNETAIDQLIDVLQQMKTVYYPKDV